MGKSKPGSCVCGHFFISSFATAYASVSPRTVPLAARHRSSRRRSIDAISHK
ncbi:hypothetical protein PF005_g549 [Phytophthora fragariae]|uniref:Uncharacterized protein n=1 Tax=Phytophthora fragariae TaxID=53985 RepID=A0A6A4AHB2_9STRA|nr:hypothetical protein PF003_g19183 [Phytophthora fragariae]KAE8949855.1 hypothetical protein PF009_g603 [Phytophthora fragariae]KAE9030983.1 hypothetical protein PF011_g336 [Phytophthora fragariae]KAE9139142.1 hypothetical protein PF010_g703 [Phytophthora fragariae]KAE9140458.1 hypothetical protein PF007_g636 [Phytophthora fragariae]